MRSLQEGAASIRRRAREVGDQVRFVGIDSLPPSDTEETFARDKGVQYELLYDPNGELTSVIGVAACPQSLFIDAQRRRSSNRPANSPPTSSKN